MKEEYDDLHRNNLMNASSTSQFFSDDAPPTVVEVECLRQQLAERDHQINQLQQELMTVKKVNDRLNGRLTALVGNNNSGDVLASASSSSSVTNSSEHSSKLHRLNQHLEQLEVKHEQTLEKMVQLSVQLAESKARVNELEGQVEDYQHQFQTAATTNNSNNHNAAGGFGSAAMALFRNNNRNTAAGSTIIMEDEDEKDKSRSGARTISRSSTSSSFSSQDQRKHNHNSDTYSYNNTTSTSREGPSKHVFENVPPITDIKLDDDDDDEDEGDEDNQTDHREADDKVEIFDLDLDELTFEGTLTSNSQTGQNTQNQGGRLMTYFSERGTKSSGDNENAPHSRLRRFF